MLIQSSPASIAHLSSIAHDGKIVVVGTDAEGSLHYTIKQDGFEDTYLSAPSSQRTGWEAWQPLALPGESDDPSVLAREQAELTYPDPSDPAAPRRYLLRSRYQTRKESAVAPVQLLSAMGHLYVFRQSRGGTLLVDRFVLDGMTNQLGRKIEVRWRRSRQKYKPSEDMKQGAGGLLNVDSVDFRDTQDQPFYEPTTEICLRGDLTDGWFSVVLVPTGEHDVHRWHIFAYDGRSQKIELLSIRASEEGLFETRDYTVMEPRSNNDPTLVPRSIPGITRRVIDPGARITGGPAATRYDLQQEREVANGREKQLLKTESRLLLTVPTESGTAALSFGIAADGTLSEIAQEATRQVLRSTERTLLLPVNTLDEIRAVGDTSPLLRGKITALRLGQQDDSAEDRIVVRSAEAAGLSDGDVIAIQGTSHYNGLYRVSGVDGDSFQIEAKFVRDELGTWEQQEEEAGGLIFDGMLTAYEKTADGKLRVSAHSHGLSDGDEVQLVGTSAHDGTFAVRKLDDTQFVIERPWPAGEARNVKLESRKRRGLVLDGQDDYVALPPQSYPAGSSITISFWAKDGSGTPRQTGVLEAVDKDNRRLLVIHLPWVDGRAYFDCGGSAGCDRIVKALQPGEYAKDEWVHWALTKDATAGEMKIFRNGTLWHSESGKTWPLTPAARVSIGALRSEDRGYFSGTLAELRIFSRALSEEEIRNGMYISLTGRELDLVGCWRLGAIFEGTEPKVIDSSINGYDGTVYGGAFAGSISLARTLRDGTPAVKYANGELIAVSQRATYVEEFEFKATANGPLDLAALNDADGTGSKIFQASVWGKSSRSAEQVSRISAEQDAFNARGDGWFRASIRFTVPDGVAFVRSFEIADVRGTFQTLEIRRHRIRHLADAVTEVRATDTVTLVPLADQYQGLSSCLKELALKEQSEADLLKEKRDLEAQLAALAAKAALIGRRKALVAEVAQLKAQEQALHDQYSAALDNPFNYVCTLAPTGDSAKRLAMYYGFLHVRDVADDPDQRFRLVRTDDGSYYIRPLGHDDKLYLSGLPDSSCWQVVFLPHGADLYQRWWIWKTDPKAPGYELRCWGVGSAHHVSACPAQNSGKAILTTAQMSGWTTFSLIKTSECTNQAAITDAFNLWQEKLRELSAKQKELDAVNALLNTDESMQARWEARLREIAGQIDTLLGEINTLNGRFLSGLLGINANAQAMPDVATDNRGLATRGAQLSFVRPASRLHAFETCEGNVQLSYFDEAGRVRQTLYDAAADSRNTTYEQWLPDAQRACLRFDSGRSVLQLSSPIALEGAWTIEAWFCHPLPQREWNVLTSSTEGADEHVAIFQSCYLGARLQGFFFSSGYSLDELAAGWHHVAVVKRGPEGAQALSYFIDGRKVGEVELPRPTLVFDRDDKYVELPSASIPADSQISICFWARDDASMLSTRGFLEGVDTSNRRVLSIALPGASGKASFFCGVEGSSIDSIEKRCPDLGSERPWVHWAFTKSTISATMCIYRNGVLLQGVTQKRRALRVPQRLRLGQMADGSTPYRGELAELSIWNKELTGAEVQALLGRVLDPKESGLVGYWRFDKDQATDQTGRKNDAKYSAMGAPGQVPAPTTLPSQIVALCNRTGVREYTEEQAVVAPSVALDGSDDYIELPPACLPKGTQLSISLWARGGSMLPKNNSIISATDASGARILSVHLPWSDGTVYFDCGQVYERVERPGDINLYRGVWTHWVFTKDVTTGVMSIYCNGAPWVSATGKTQPLAPAAQLVVGLLVDGEGGGYHGEIAELGIWDKALTAQEVQQLWTRSMSGTEPGLRASYSFEIDRARDRTSGGYHGTYRGGAALTAAGSTGLNLSTRVTRCDEGAPFGRVAEVRIWRAALSDAEIEANSVSLLSGNEPDLLAYYPLDEATGSEARDRTGSDRKALINSASWWACAAPFGRLHDARVMAFAGTVAAEAVPGVLVDVPAFTLEAWVRVSSRRDQSLLLFGQSSLQLLLNSGCLELRAGQSKPVLQPQKFPINEWHHVAGVGDGATLRLYVDGVEVMTRHPIPQRYGGANESFRVYAYPDGSAEGYGARFAEVRAWSCARTALQIRAAMGRALTGREPELQGYWPLDQSTTDAMGVLWSPDRSRMNHPLRLTPWAGVLRVVHDATIPLGGDAVVAAEYSTIGILPSGRKQAVMRRLLAIPRQQGAQLVFDKRIENLDLQWIGNGQFAPTLLGYIEGAPPIPSENLTVEPSYNGATSVELAMTEDVEFRWSRSQDAGLGMDLDLFVGADTESYAGFGAMTKAADVRAGVKGSLSLGYQFTNDSNITTSSSQRMTDRLELRGSPERSPKFPHLGTRFVPKNVGYALVISSLADIFVTKLARTGKMVSYQVRPVEGVPPDVNTITFLMNPAYTMQGSLDGMTGSRATSDRFFKHVPQMRAQYGSLYPASYYRLREAYDLKQQIENDDKRREAYFAQFDVRLLDEGAMNRQIDKGAAPAEIGVKREEDKMAKPLSEDEQKAADKARSEALAREAEAAGEKQTAAVKKKQAEIDKQIEDQEKRAHAAACFASWQEKMQDILIRAGKRNIVNTYVWDADGGLRTESQSFASTAEHSIGGSFTLDGSLGFEGNFGVFGAKVELTALATANLTQTMSKTESRSKGIELTVDLSGVESTGITDHDDLPLVPGEKVDRYRFMSFYLEGATRNFQDFFSYVVDPEWLRSNDEEARALRQAMGKANKAWRVLHRVTYVERPALMGFGRDLRPVENSDRATDEILRYFEQLEERHKEVLAQLAKTNTRLTESEERYKLIEAKLDQILSRP